MKKNVKVKLTVQEKQERSNEIFKLILSAISLCLVMFILLYVYHTMIPDILAGYEEKGNMEHTAWLVKYSAYLPPVIVMAVMLTVLYRDKKYYVPVKTQKNKALIVGIVAAFTYVVMLGYVLLMSPGWNIPAVEGEEKVLTLFESTASWFFAQIVPFAILISYHLIRASSEEKEIEKSESV